MEKKIQRERKKREMKIDARKMKMKIKRLNRGRRKE